MSWCSRPLRLAPLILVALAFAQPSPAAASFPAIDGVWSFNGGKVAVQRQPDGTFMGTVVAATKFAECSHPIGEAMWTDMRARVDGSYWGLHRWFFEGAGCVLNPQLGPTAWRVLTSSTGAHFLRACFSTPGTMQPTISLTGSTEGVSYGCADSALISPPPSTSGAAGFKSAVTLPSSRRCLSRRAFTIHVRDPRNDPVREVVVKLAGRRLRVLRQGARFVSRIDLRGLPRGSFTVHIGVTTVLGHRLSGARTYHTCVRGRRRPARAR
jgi:hypothetical protein